MLDRRLKAVIFDLWGTLVYPFSRTQHERVLTEMAETLSVDRDGLARMWAHDTWFDRTTGAFATIDENVEHICQSLGARVDDESLRLAVSNSNRPRPSVASAAIRCSCDADPVEGFGIHRRIAQQLFR